METIITAYIESTLMDKVKVMMEFFKKYNIKVANMSFDLTSSPNKCVIKTVDNVE